MQKIETLRLADITKESIVDGPGIRYVLWSQGCKHHCKGCFNPHTHSFAEGKDYSIDMILKEIGNNPLLQGITCSGGDPFEQADAFAYICAKVKHLGLDVWCYTGYTFSYIVQNLRNKPDWKSLLSHIDVLVDGRFEETQKDLTLAFRGSSNQQIIDVQKSLGEKKIILWENPSII